MHPPAPARDRALVPVLVFLGMVVAVVSSLGAPLIPTLAATDHVSLWPLCEDGGITTSFFEGKEAE